MVERGEECVSGKEDRQRVEGRGVEGGRLSEADVARRRLHGALKSGSES